MCLPTYKTLDIERERIVVYQSILKYIHVSNERIMALSVNTINGKCMFPMIVSP